MDPDSPEPPRQRISPTVPNRPVSVPWEPCRSAYRPVYPPAAPCAVPIRQSPRYRHLGDGRIEGARSRTATAQDERPKPGPAMPSPQAGSFSPPPFVPMVNRPATGADWQSRLHPKGDAEGARG